MLPQTLTYIINNLRSLLWDIFSWDIKVFTNCQQNIVFAQVVSACSYRTVPVMEGGCYKEKGVQPALELYLLLPKGTNETYLDAWSFNTIDARVLFPTQTAAFYPDTADNSSVIAMTLPQYPEMFLKAMYGNWTKYSSKHGLAKGQITYT